MAEWERTRGTPLAGGRVIQRAVNLTFRMTNAKEQFEEVRMITRAIAHAIMMLRALRLAHKVTMLAMGGVISPYYLAMFGVTAMTEVFMISQEFTPKEEYGARGSR